MPLPTQQEFLKKYKNLPETAIELCGLSWDELSEIHDLHLSRTKELEAAAKYITDILPQIPEVHSLRFRIKNAEHLVEKIIRKKLADADRVINSDNYESEITDLIGIRAMHLFKQDWEAIHNFLTHSFETHEQPKAYIREGDARESYGAKDCAVEIHPAGYRSVHYLVTTTPSRKSHIAEVQVRTLFEEGWSEIDHRLRYPYETDDILLGQLLSLLNRLAGSADEMGSYVALLKDHLRAKAAERDEAISECLSLTHELTDVIRDLKVTKQQKTELEQKVSTLSLQVQVTQADKSTGLLGLGKTITSQNVNLPTTALEEAVDRAVAGLKAQADLIDLRKHHAKK